MRFGRTHRWWRRWLEHRRLQRCWIWLGCRDPRSQQCRKISTKQYNWAFITNFKSNQENQRLVYLKNKNSKHYTIFPHTHSSISNLGSFSLSSTNPLPMMTNDHFALCKMKLPGLRKLSGISRLKLLARDMLGSNSLTTVSLSLADTWKTGEDAGLVLSMETW